MNKKIKSSILFSVMVAGLSFIFFSSISFSGDDFDDVSFYYWQKRLLDPKSSKNDVLLEMLGKAVRNPDGRYTFSILQIQGPSLFYGDNSDNKRDFQRLLLNLFKTQDLYKLKSFYGIKEGEGDLLVARVFDTVHYLYAVETGFSYHLRENLKGTLSWDWNDSKSPELLTEIIKSMDELLGPKVSYHIRARVKNIQRVGGIEKVVVVTEWELTEVESVYNPTEDKMELKDKTVEKSSPVVELLDKVEADKIEGEGDYGTKTGLLLERAAAIALFQSLSKTTRIFENPSPRNLGSSNWERVMPLLSPLLGGMSFVLIPAGTFEMGSPNSESNREGDESPHRVTLTKSFEMVTTEVTQKQWEEVMGSNPSNFKGEDHPIENVSWVDAIRFANKLSELHGFKPCYKSTGSTVGVDAPSIYDCEGYRLPTEAEWEYAAREGAKIKTAYSFGDNPAFLKERGWFNENSGETTHPVASCPTKEKAKANAFGLYDMHGNVWEWISDWYGAYPTGTVTDPTGSESGSYRVVRGGSWGSDARYCRSADRGNGGTGYRNDYVGFRLARTRR